MSSEGNPSFFQNVTVRSQGCRLPMTRPRGLIGQRKSSAPDGREPHTSRRGITRPDRLRRGLLLLAYFIELDGDIHVALFERLESELCDLQRKASAKERAHRLLCDYSSRAGEAKAIRSRYLSLSSSEGPRPYLGLSSIEPDDGSCEVDGSEEVPVGFVIAGCDGTILFEPAEEVLDQMAGLVEVLVIVARRFSIALGRNDRRLAGFAERFDHPLVGIEALVGDHRIGGDRGKKRIGAVEIMGLARSEMEAGRIAERIGSGVDLGAQSASA